MRSWSWQCSWAPETKGKVLSADIEVLKLAEVP
jgi:hypothetical protein